MLGLANLTAAPYVAKCHAVNSSQKSHLIVSKTDSFAAFETSRFITTERWSLRKTALALPIRVSILFRLSSLVNNIPRYLNFSTCCSVILLTCSIHWLEIVERRSTSSDLVVLSFIPAWSHAAGNRSSWCWRPCTEDGSRTKLSAK